MLWISTAGCGVLRLPIYSSANAPVTGSTAFDPYIPKVAELKHGVLVGVALSGGGSRAANFGAAVLFELERLGFLKDVSMISSVSGGSLVAAYYGLFSGDPQRWNIEEVRQLLLRDFEFTAAIRLLLPHNLLRLAFTDYDSSDLLAEVFDDYLFEKRTLAQLPSRPLIYINATERKTLFPFEFTPFQFNYHLNSDWQSYPVARAVMASAAFPGLLPDVTLRSYARSSPAYVHLFDGGPSDNYGLRTLLVNAATMYGKAPPPSACFFFLIDGQSSQFSLDSNLRAASQSDLRKPWDYIVNTNVLDAMDALFLHYHHQLLSGVRIVTEGVLSPFVPRISYESRPFGEPVKLDCAVWHISLQRLVDPSFMIQSRDEIERLLPEFMKLRREVGDPVNAIETRFKLTGPSGFSDKELQDLLFKAARLLVQEDRGSPLKRVCQWFVKHGFTDHPCQNNLN